MEYGVFCLFVLSLSLCQSHFVIFSSKVHGSRRTCLLWDTLIHLQCIRHGRPGHWCIGRERTVAESWTRCVWVLEVCGWGVDILYACVNMLKWKACHYLHQWSKLATSVTSCNKLVWIYSRSDVSAASQLDSHWLASSVSCISYNLWAITLCMFWRKCTSLVTLCLGTEDISINISSANFCPFLVYTQQSVVAVVWFSSWWCTIHFQ